MTHQTRSEPNDAPDENLRRRQDAVVEDAGVTVVVRRRVRPEAGVEFDAWLKGILAATAAFPGHLGANIVRPAPGAEQDWMVIFRFDTAAHLEAWERSPERAEWLSRAEALTIGEADKQTVTGLEYWFSLPDQAATRPPPAWKMAVVTLTGLFPLVLFLAPFLARLLAALPQALAVLLTVATLVALMTWVVMPVLVRLARPWLFPRAGGGR